MKTKEKLQFIIDNDLKGITNTDLKFINLLNKKVKLTKEMEEAKTDLLEENLFSYRNQWDEALKLDILYFLLNNYLREKNLKESLIKADELLSMIINDQSKNKDLRFNTQLNVEGIKVLLENQTKN